MSRPPPGINETEKSSRRIAEQIIRPTGLSDPIVTVKPAKHQVDDLLEEIHKRVKKKSGSSSPPSPSEWLRI